MVLAFGLTLFEIKGVLTSVIFLLFHLPKNFRRLVAKAIKHGFVLLFLKNLRRRREKKLIRHFHDSPKP